MEKHYFAHPPPPTKISAEAHVCVFVSLCCLSLPTSLPYIDPIGPTQRYLETVMFVSLSLPTSLPYMDPIGPTQRYAETVIFGDTQLELYLSSRKVMRVEYLDRMVWYFNPKTGV